jgi:hypothetical protein
LPEFLSGTEQRRLEPESQWLRSRTNLGGKGQFENTDAKFST